MASSQSRNYDVFLSFRGEDTRKTFVEYLYSTLVDRMISTYKDYKTLPRGESIRPSLFKAIEGSRIALIIFSEKYADSSWCLEELAHIMKCRNERELIVMPIFYCVDPSEVRKQKGNFGEGFAKHVTKNINMVESWREALISASEIAGWEPKNIANGHEMKAIKEIVDTISDKLLSLTSNFDEDLVGMRVRMQELEARLEIGSGGVRMVGIWGVGGSGKTTLASSLCIKISRHFQGYCIVDNIRDESSKHGLKTQQEKVLSCLLKTHTELQSVAHGKHIIRSRLSRSNVLIFLDDIDGIEQLEALAGSHNWFGSGSRIIITTRDEHLLITHKVDEVCQVMLLSDEEAIQLFNKRAFNEKKPVKDYEILSSSVVSYAAGLPLALKVLGSFLCGKDEEEWRCTLARLKDNPEMEIVEKLKISYDGLKPLEKQLFLDIACFFRRDSIDDVIEIFEACSYYPRIGITVLRQKALITIVHGRINMHDLVEEMAHYIVKGDNPNNPEKHSRVWEYENIMYLASATMENDKIEAIRVDYNPQGGGDSSLLCKMISNMKKLRWLSVSPNYRDHAEGPNFLSNELRYIYWENYPISPFPDSFQLMKLVVLRLNYSMQKELWKGYKHLPNLKVLQLICMKNLLSTPDFDGLPCLQKLELEYCYEITEIHPSLGNHTSLEYLSVSKCSKLRMFPTMVQMGKLKTLKIEQCHENLEFPDIKSNMESLVKLSLTRTRVDTLLSLVGERCANLISLHLFDCYYLQIRIVNINFNVLKHLEDFRLRCYGTQPSIWVKPLILYPQLIVNLQKLVLENCHLTEIPFNIGELSNLRELNLSNNYFRRSHFSFSQLTRLKFLDLSNCKWLAEFPELPSRLAILRAHKCYELKAIGDSIKSCKWLCDVSLMDGRIIDDGNRVLESMLEGNAIENHNMVLQLQGLEIAKRFKPPLLRGSSCRLQLPENWCNDFSGFLMCAVLSDRTCFTSLNMKQVMSGMKSEDDVVWDESYSNKFRTYVWYVSFASLRHTTWWDETYNAVLFSIDVKGMFRRADTSGFGVRLVARKSGSGPTQTTTAQDSDFSRYTPKLDTYHDSAHLSIFLKKYLMLD